MKKWLRCKDYIFYSSNFSFKKVIIFQNYTPEFLIDQLSNTFVVGFDESDETRRSGSVIALTHFSMLSVWSPKNNNNFPLLILGCWIGLNNHSSKKIVRIDNSYTNSQLQNTFQCFFRYFLSLLVAFIKIIFLLSIWQP